MRSAHPIQSVSAVRRGSKWQVRAIEYRRWSVTEPAGFARVVGRVGALAVALGVGSAVAAMPMAFADTRGSAGSSGSGTSDTSAGSSASGTAPARGTSRVRGSAAAPARNPSSDSRNDTSPATTAASATNRRPRPASPDALGIATGVSADLLASTPTPAPSMDGAGVHSGSVTPSSVVPLSGPVMSVAPRPAASLVPTVIRR